MLNPCYTNKDVSVLGGEQKIQLQNVNLWQGTGVAVQGSGDSSRGGPEEEGQHQPTQIHEQVTAMPTGSTDVGN